ncbi:hypothetical protein PGT21_012455 [Puccinia graminis f. sp. tritici]|nr:hypothetical protein PGT21_012455 [Puccinia graminis f. sp. tritici]
MLDPSNASECVPDCSSIRQESPFTSVDEQTNTSGGIKNAPKKRQLTTKACDTQSTVVATASLADVEDPLLNAEEIIQIINNQPAAAAMMRVPGFTTSQQLLNMSSKEAARHLANLTSSVVTALKGINHVLKSAKLAACLL